MDFHPMPRYLMRKHAIEKILREFSCEDKDLLEIGYGSGEIFSTYLALGINCYGYDLSEEAYNYANDKIDRSIGKIKLLKEKKEIYAKKYDFVVACEVLEHIENDIQELLDWKSHLVEQGKLLFSVPAHQKRWDNNDISSGHFKRYEKKELINLLYKLGFEVKCFYTYDFPSCLILDPIRSNRAKKNTLLTNSKTIVTKEELTKISGINRDQNKFFRLLSNKYLLYPIMKFQECFYKYDFGSAYIVLCEKIK